MISVFCFKSIESNIFLMAPDTPSVIKIFHLSSLEILITFYKVVSKFGYKIEFNISLNI